MSHYKPPTYFEQPHRILGYRIVGFSPIRLQEPEYAKAILTMPIDLHTTWAAAWAATQARVTDTKTHPGAPAKIGLEDFAAFAANPAKVADYRHSIEVGNAPTIELNTDYSRYTIAITVVLGEELDCDDCLSTDSE